MPSAFCISPIEMADMKTVRSAAKHARTGSVFMNKPSMSSASPSSAERRHARALPNTTSSLPVKRANVSAQAAAQAQPAVGIGEFQGVGDEVHQDAFDAGRVGQHVGDGEFNGNFSASALDFIRKNAKNLASDGI